LKKWGKVSLRSGSAFVQKNAKRKSSRLSAKTEKGKKCGKTASNHRGNTPLRVSVSGLRDGTAGRKNEKKKN